MSDFQSLLFINTVAYFLIHSDLSIQNLDKQKIKSSGKSQSFCKQAFEWSFIEVHKTFDVHVRIHVGKGPSYYCCYYYYYYSCHHWYVKYGNDNKSDVNRSNGNSSNGL